MKIIFVVALVSVFAISQADLSVSVSGVSWPNPGRTEPRPDEPTFSHYSLVEFLLVFQYEKRVAEIFDALKACNETWSVPRDEAIELFENPPPGLLRLTNKPAKCLIDCVIRKTGVMTDAGFQVDQYMLQFKQLRLNYTSYNLNSKPRAEKEEVLAAIKKFAEGNPKNYEMIEAYEWAANECKGRKDPDDDNCQTSWLIARCIINRAREKHFNAPFYPADLSYLK
ncbi:hypothetical protein HA402_007555 [Bradysia odoriphaga]|nr:hypothetical protein HA402_007555 [Bradysia odoriphaga]